MNYTSGTTGNPKGVYRPLLGRHPRAGAPWASAGILFLFGINPQDDNVHIVGSPLYHTAVLRFAGAVDPLRPHRRAHGQVDARGDARADRAVPGDHLAHGPHPVPPAPGPARRRPRQRYDVSSLRHMIHAAAPCPSTSSTR